MRLFGKRMLKQFRSHCVSQFAPLLVAYLVRQGWEAAVDCPAFYRTGPHGVRQFPSDWLGTTINHLRCLALAPVVLRKAPRISGICHTCPNIYYKHLMTTPTLHDIALLTEGFLDGVREAAQHISNNSCHELARDLYLPPPYHRWLEKYKHEDNMLNAFCSCKVTTIKFCFC